MISQIKLKFGSAPGKDAKPIDVAPVTIFVGPNNAGKSKILQEINQFCQSGQTHSLFVILESLKFSGLDAKGTQQAIARLRQQTVNATADAHVTVRGFGFNAIISTDRLTRLLTAPHDDPQQFCESFLCHKTLLLGGTDRLNLVRERGASDLQGPPQHAFDELFRNQTKRSEVRRIVYEAFGRYLVIDPTSLQQLRIRLSDTPPQDVLEEIGIHPHAVKFHSKAELINETSDGVKIFAGMMIEIIAGDPGVILIDEPEAFLHPSLASKLGLEVSRAAARDDKRVFFSTHSPFFVMGCLNSKAPINVVRLTYRSGVATARALPSHEMLEIMQDPLLRSTGVISALFYEFVIVVEADSDRVFYQEINERLLQFKSEWGIPNCLFINAQNKQTVSRIIRLLRKLGIPAAAIVDVDIFKEGGTVWSSLMSAAYVPELSRNSLATLRASIKQAMDQTNRDMKRDGGIDILSQEERESATSLIAQLNHYGLFPVPCGELESWLKHVGVQKQKPQWLIEMFGKMGNDPAAESYLKPTDDDVWAFIAKVRRWMVDPSRKGIPVET